MLALTVGDVRPARAYRLQNPASCRGIRRGTGPGRGGERAAMAQLWRYRLQREGHRRRSVHPPRRNASG